MIGKRLPDFRLIAEFVSALAASAGPRRWTAGLAVIGGALLEGAGYLLLVPIFGVVMGDPRTDAMLPAGLGERGDLGLLALLLLAFLAAMVARALVLHWRDLMLWRLTTGFVEAERNRVMRGLAGARWTSVAALQHARVTNLLSTEMGRVAIATQMLVQIVVSVVMLSVQGALALALAPALAGAVLALLLVTGVALMLLPDRSRAIGVEVNLSALQLMQNATSLLGGLKAAIAQNLQAGFVAEFEALQARAHAYQLRFVRQQARGRLWFGIASALAGALVIVVGLGVFEVPAPVLVTLLVILVRISVPALSLHQSLQQVAYNLPAFESMRALGASLAAEQAPAEGGAPLPPGPIEVRDARFVHASGGGVQEASLVLRPGELVGITGASGCGKTTLLDMVVGLIEPQSGSVTVGGAPLEAATIGGWRREIAYAVQDQFLFHDSVRRNLDWDATRGEPELWEALELVGAAGLVRGLDKGLDTVIGERGALLSGGERQRLGLARALLRKPRLLVLDEATSSLDVASERDVLARLRDAPTRPTVLMVSHRAESLDACDRVLTMVDGRLSG